MLHSRLAIPAALGVVAIGLMIVFAPVLAEVSVGSKAPDFKLGCIDGKTVCLSDLTDKPTLIIFWASWCPHCRTELPVVDKVYRDLHPKGANVVGVSLDDNPSAARDFVRNNHISFPIAVAGTKSDLLGNYGISGIPAVFVLGRSGVVKARYSGEVSESTIRDQFAKLGVK